MRGALAAGSVGRRGGGGSWPARLRREQRCGWRMRCDPTELAGKLGAGGACLVSEAAQQREAVDCLLGEAVDCPWGVG